jgi:putative methionine-R-sulfoxide reductase with GAF domain
MAVLTRLPLENLRLVSETRTRLLEICAREQSPEAVLRGALEELYAVVPYEIATYYEYSEGGDDAAACDPQSSGHIRRIRFTLDRERPGFAWPMRWMSVPKAIDQWTRSPQPLIDDIEEFIAGLSETSAEHLKRHISTQAATSENLRSFLYFPYWRGARIVSALSFASRSSRKFTPLHQEALCAIGLPQVLELIGAAYDRSSEKFYRGIANLFQSGAVPGQLASDFVREIADEYRWDYVGIFRVARVSGHFRVVAQQDNTGELTIDRDYLQPIDRGVLGTVLREQRPIRISDVDTEGRKFDYIKLGENHKSCLCFPISVGGNVEWILDCESTQQAAFAKPDQARLRV